MIPYLTVVSVNKNNYEGLIITLISLKNNVISNSIQHIIIDGNSCDLVVSFDDLKNKYDFDYISENDSGIYAAMNKGVLLSSSERLLFLNSGDSIIDKNIFSQFSNSYSNFELVYTNVLKVNTDGLINLLKFPDVLSLDYMICYGLPHQATIIKKSLFDKIGLYNENYKIISDWVFFMEALFFHNATYKYVNVTAINFDGSGISNQTKYLRTIINEQLDYISNRFPLKLDLYKSNSPYVKKYFRTMPRWKRFILKYLFIKFNILIK
jgi:hypothetical protein